MRRRGERPDPHRRTHRAPPGDLTRRGLVAGVERGFEGVNRAFQRPSAKLPKPEERVDGLGGVREWRRLCGLRGKLGRCPEHVESSEGLSRACHFEALVWSHRKNPRRELLVFGPVGDGFLGTRSHPVHVDGIGWVELADAGLSDLGPRDVSIDTLYNLEIDGDAPGASNHSYVVGDLVASGNGDGRLNELFPRQKVWGATPP